MMCFFDILSSTAFSISKTAMPSDSGRIGARGNSVTCTAQGICVWLGFVVAMYNTSLNLFYLLSIKYGMDSKHFSEKIEPFLHLVSILSPLSVAITFAALGWILPYGNVCVGAALPAAIGITCFVSFCLLFCVFSMISICWAVRQRTNIMRRYRFRPPANCIRTSATSSSVLEEIETVKQALLYTSAFILTFTSPLLQSIRVLMNTSSPRSKFLVISTGLLYPLQGFWNFVLYIRPGVNRIRRRDPDIYLIEAIRRVVFNVRSLENGQSEGACPNEDDSNEDASIAEIVNDNLTQMPSILAEDDCRSQVRSKRRRSFVQLSSVLYQESLDDLAKDDIETASLHIFPEKLNRDTSNEDASIAEIVSDNLPQKPSILTEDASSVEIINDNSP